MVANQRVTDHQKDHEIDIVVAVAGQGIITLEIKGGVIWHDGTDWYQERRTGATVINPVRQARDGCYALRYYVELLQCDVVARALVHEDAADSLSMQEAAILDATRLLTRVAVRGGAGSGKRFLAVEQARRLSASEVECTTTWPNGLT